MASRVAWLPLVTLMVAGTALRAAPDQQGAQLKQSKGTIFGPHQPQQPYVVTGNTNPAQSALSGGARYAPNAGQTGLNASGGTNNGWAGTPPGNGKGQKLIHP
jgi:hypothetical protein